MFPHSFEFSFETFPPSAVFHKVIIVKQSTSDLVIIVKQSPSGLCCFFLEESPALTIIK